MGQRRTATQAPLVLAIAGACTLALAWRHLQWPHLLAAAVLLGAAGALPWASRRFGWRWRMGTRRAGTAGRIELSSRKTVVAAGNRMLRACRSGERPLSVAVVELSDLPEVRSLFGSDVAGQIIRRMAVRLQTIAADGGLAERTSATQFTVLLPGMEAAAARRALRAMFGEGGCVEYEGDGDELVLLPEFRVAEVPEHHTSILKTYASVCPAPATAGAPDAAPPGAANTYAYAPTVPVPL